MTLPARPPSSWSAAGSSGPSMAYHLARPGSATSCWSRRTTSGSGSTCKAAGGVRAQFSDAVNIELGLRSLRTFETFAEQFDQEIDLHQVGYLFLLDEPERRRRLRAERRAAERARRAEPDARRSPRPGGCAADRPRRARWRRPAAPPTGTARPESVVLGYAGAARRHGARLVTGCAVDRHRRRGGGIVRGRHDGGTVRDRHGRLRRRRVVGGDRRDGRRRPPGRRRCAARSLLTGPMPGARPADRRSPSTSQHLLLPRRGRRAAARHVGPARDAGIRARPLRRWLPALRRGHRSAARPALADVGIASGWAGLYEMTPGPQRPHRRGAGVGRFLYATGFSGHGFLMGPAVGEVVRDLVPRPPAVRRRRALARRPLRRAGARPEPNIV